MNSDHLVLRARGKVLLVRAPDVVWIEARGNYSVLHLERESHPVRRTIHDLQAALDPSRFRRVHRSAIVNLSAVREIRSVARGRYDVVLSTGTVVPLSRYRARAVFESLPNSA